MTKQSLSYEAFGYQKFFIDDVDYARELLEANHDRMEKLMFADDSRNLWREYFGRVRGLEMWLKAEGDLPKGMKMIDGVTQGDLRRRSEVFCHSPTDIIEGEYGRGYGGPLMWYVSHNKNLNVEDERNERVDWKSWKSGNDTILVLCDKDPIALPSIQIAMARSHVKVVDEQLRCEHLASGHFVMYERSRELNQLLEDFFD